MTEFRPVPNDPSAHIVEGMLTTDSTWIVTAPGDYTTFAAEAMRNDGTGYQQLIAITLPGRHNHTDDRVEVKVMIHPEDAVGLAKQLLGTASWLAAARRQQN